ncbi:MAG TPA: lysylphosphatidylglycerol synthase transmembrane domain-containing protein [Dehalococcoidia bacterium]|nr:lysylphosphatidylglycerol synthase transmembrane domain-containing protein [Dehalococcoidia bacterium]
MSRHIAAVILLLAATAVIVLQTDVEEAIGLLGEIEAGWAVAATALFGLSKVVHGVRWKVLMAPFADAPLGDTCKLFLLGNLVNALLPLRAGDVVRVQIAARRLGVPRAQITSSVFVVETLFDGVALVGLLLGALALSDVPGLTRGLLIGLAAASVGACVTAALLAPRAEKVGALIGSSSLPGSDRLARFVEGLLDGLRPFNQPGVLGVGLVLACVGWLIEAGAYALMGEAFGLGLDAPDYLAVMVAANLLTAVPLTPLGLGVYELGVQEVVQAFGPSSEVALAYALGSHVLFTLWIVGAGLIAAWTLPVRAEEVLYLKGEAEAPSSGGDRR